MTTKILLGVGAVVLAVVLFLVLRPDDDDDGEANPTPATETTATTTEEATTEEATTEEATTEETTEETTTEAAGPQRIAVRFANERVVGGVKSVPIERDNEVLLVVRSDVADEVHVHGYDLSSEIEPGQPVRIEFQAVTPGRFDVELEERAAPLVVLEVQ